MIVEEKAANQFWCPFVRIDANKFPRPGVDPDKYTGCMGSTCMLWQKTRAGTGFCGMVKT